MPHLSTSTEQEDTLRDSFGAKVKQERVTISTQQLMQVSADSSQFCVFIPYLNEMK